MRRLSTITHRRTRVKVRGLVTPSPVGVAMVWLAACGHVTREQLLMQQAGSFHNDVRWKRFGAALDSPDLLIVCIIGTERWRLVPHGRSVAQLATDRSGASHSAP